MPFPAGNALGMWVIFVPIVGGLIVGFMARYGSKAIRGHGIPEAMEQVLVNDSRIPARLTFLKPVSAAISIGTGGPFGAEGPIIATGGALGSLVGQITSTTPAERKTLLAAGAAAGMAATFGSPVSAVLLAIELLLFEFRARSIIPVALASATATGLRLLIFGSKPIFAMGDLVAGTAVGPWSFTRFSGLVLGLVAAGVTRLVYWVEELFDRLPDPLDVVACAGSRRSRRHRLFRPRHPGRRLLQHHVDPLERDSDASWSCSCALMKLLSWSISLSSGTSGGTLAPLLTIGAGFGQTLAAMAIWVLPHAGIDLRIAALVGMAALFAGASHAFLASTVFAFETTLSAVRPASTVGGMRRELPGLRSGEQALDHDGEDRPAWHPDTGRVHGRSAGAGRRR